MNYLADFQVFNSKQELNHHVNEHEKAHYDVLNATNRNIFRFIARYSVKYAGASHLKVETIANGVGVSYRTVSRALNLFESLNMAKRIERTRPKTGGRGASIIQIQPFMSYGTSEGETAEKADDTTDKQDNSENETLRKLDKHNARTRDDKQGLKTAIPGPIYKALSPFFNAKELYDVYGILLRAKAKADRTITLEENAQAYTDEFYNVIRNYKQGKVSNLKGLLYSAWQKVTSEVSRLRERSKGGLIGDFETVISS